MNMIMRSRRPDRASQNGAVLVVSMLLLLVLTILAIGASQTTRLQERMAGNTRDVDLAFQASEAGLRAAEDFLSNPATSLAPCSNPASATCYVLQQGHFANTDLTRQTDTWWRTNGKPYGAPTTQEVQGVVEEPRFVVEEFQTVPFSLTVGHGAPPVKVFYKSTAWAHGGTETSQAVVESVFSRD
jgi:type IV pilus assembly protein PilX